jgi:hypothetical protein
LPFSMQSAIRVEMVGLVDAKCHQDCLLRATKLKISQSIPNDETKRFHRILNKAPLVTYIKNHSCRTWWNVNKAIFHP